VLPKPARDQRTSLRCQFNLAHTPVAGVIFARDESFFYQSIDRHADRAWRQPHLRTHRIHWQRSLMQERFENAEIRVAQLGSLDAIGGMRHQSLEGFHENEPDVNATGVLHFGDRFSFHKIIY
jgi:hypothetical protein